MWFDGIRQPNTLYVANTSRGKDSTAMLRAIQLMGWPLDMICSVDVWATDTIPAELPPMVAFKDEYDKKVLEWLGIPVTRLCATKKGTEKQEKLTYEDVFYRKVTPKRERERIAARQKLERKFPNLRIPDAVRQLVPIGSQTIGTLGFPNHACRWCTGELKIAASTASQIRLAVGVQENSRDPHQRLSLEERCLVSRQTQGRALGQPSPTCPSTRGRR